VEKKEKMKRINKILKKILDSYSNIKKIEKQEFLNELTKIKKALTARIEFKEKELYLSYKVWFVFF